MHPTFNELAAKGCMEVTVKTCHIVFLSPFDTRHTMEIQCGEGLNSVHPVFIYDTVPARSALSPRAPEGKNEPTLASVPAFASDRARGQVGRRRRRRRV
eukprot:scaffold141664_cov105-Phaeocystis_antarctica.AAC.1